LDNEIKPSPNPLIFIPRPLAAFTSSLTGEVAFAGQESAPPALPKLGAVRPNARGNAVDSSPPPPAAEPERTTHPPAAQTAEIVAECARYSFSWTSACRTELGNLGAAVEAEIMTMDDGVYVKN
jgi:hypothetical protein